MIGIIPAVVGVVLWMLAAVVRNWQGALIRKLRHSLGLTPNQSPDGAADLTARMIAACIRLQLGGEAFGSVGWERGIVRFVGPFSQLAACPSAGFVAHVRGVCSLGLHLV